ncbi:TetR/AcrR family transcriptional regulator [Actinomadura fibrosa]|uniref:TetR/AcrR family transcriptional regulator n=1 Tax=Actinomadura fibrosa TaxID=111802 RepID=A0ABW2XHE0_9ACTN|nr:TetR/AcrR family transcriptional regulator [Actinomadura fibrosa]
MANTSKTPRERADDVWARPPAGRRPKLTREAIVETAIKLADAEGLDAVSIRRIASELGVRAMSLYTHIDAKEDILDLMYDEVAGEALIEEELPDDWREACLQIVRRERQASRDHPWMFELARRSPRVGPNGLRHAEQTFAAVARLTDDPEAMVAIATALDNYSLGFAIREQHTVERGECGLQSARSSMLERRYVRSLLESGEFPHLKPLLELGVLDQDTFEQGLTWLLDGIERDYGR